MQHLVRFRTAEGRDGHHIAETLEEGVAFVERLRNTEGSSDVELFRLTAVPIEFKTYYRVEVNGAEVPGTPAAAPTVGTAHTPSAAPVAAVEEPAAPAVPASTDSLPESAAANGRRLFSRT
ncbi:MAG: hypothetical protein ABGZ36_11060 [Actinomycetota bacterium]